MGTVNNFLDFTVTGVTCSPPGASARAECCASRIGSSAGSWAYSFCLAICVLCCMVCTITFKYNDDEGPGGPDVDAPTDGGPQYPVIVPKPNGGMSFTTSAYGIGLPLVFGSDRLTGNVFWSNGFTQNKYVYKKERFYYTTTSFALGLCEGTVTGIVRLWVGDTLVIDNSAEVDVNNVLQPRANGFLSGASVDFTDPKSPLRNLNSSRRTTRISVFNGNERQLPQGVMVTEEGYDNTPGYRGVAYVLFENFIVSDDGIPEITVELTANTSVLYPRLYGDYDDPTATPTLDRAMPNAILVDMSYDQILVPSTSSTTSDEGLARFDANNLDAFDGYDMEGLTYDGETLGTANWDGMQVLSTGYVALTENAGNSGVLWIWNPFAGAFSDVFGPGGGLFGHDADGFGATNLSTCVFQHNPDGGIPMDAFFGIGVLNNSWGVAYIDKNGQVIDFVWDNGVIPGDYNRPVPLYIDATTAAASPTFADASSSGGTHVFVVGTPGTTEQFTTFMHVLRISFRRTDATDTSSMTNYSFDTISCTDMGGEGFDHTIKYVFVDPVDSCLVIMMRIASRSDRIIKYSPFTGQIVWNTAVTEFETGDFQAAPTAAIAGRTYVWHDVNNILYEIDLDTGEVTTLFDLDAQSLPSPHGEIGFYNGYEDCYIYTANSTNQRIVKVYLRKIQRATVDLADVVQNLLQRVGVSPSDINTEDVTGLAMYGYTIKQPQTLRVCFSELAQAFKYDLVESNGTFLYKSRGSSSGVTIPHTALMDVNDNGWIEETQENDIARVRKLILTYRDIDREYNDNVQSITLPDYINLELDNDSPMEVKVPVVLESVDARKLAEILLFAKLVYNSTYEIRLPPKYSYLDPGDIVTITRENPDLDSVVMRLRNVDIGSDKSVSVTTAAEDPDIYNDVTELFGNIGRYERGEIPPIPQRVDPYLLSIPGRTDDEIAEANDGYTIYMTFLNNRTVTPLANFVSITINGTETLTLDQPTTYPTWGYVSTPLDFKVNFYSTDEDSTLIVRLISATGATLAAAASKDAMLADRKINLAIVGQELIQFRDVTSLGDGYYQLGHIHRALNGTEIAVGGHVPGERFVLLGDNTGVLDETSIIKLVTATGSSPQKVLQINTNTGNPFQPPFAEYYIATNLRPFSVGGTDFYYENDGDAYMEWQYRPRYNGDLNAYEFGTVPNSGEAEEYTYYLFDDPTTFNTVEPSTYLRKGTTTTNSFTYTAAMQTTDGFDRTTDRLHLLVYISTGATLDDIGAGIQVNIAPKS